MRNESIDMKASTLQWEIIGLLNLIIPSLDYATSDAPEGFASRGLDQIAIVNGSVTTLKMVLQKAEEVYGLMDEASRLQARVG